MTDRLKLSFLFKSDRIIAINFGYIHLKNLKYIPSSLYDEGIAKNNRPHLNVDETFTVPRDALSAKKKLKWKRFIITIKKNKSIRVSFLYNV